MRAVHLPTTCKIQPGMLGRTDAAGLMLNAAGGATMLGATSGRTGR